MVVIGGRIDLDGGMEVVLVWPSHTRADLVNTSVFQFPRRPSLSLEQSVAEVSGLVIESTTIGWLVQCVSSCLLQTSLAMLYACGCHP